VGLLSDCRLLPLATNILVSVTNKLAYCATVFIIFLKDPRVQSPRPRNKIPYPTVFYCSKLECLSPISNSVIVVGKVGAYECGVSF
jgi:hypothetical protein